MFVHSQVLEYFKVFADEFDLRRHIRLRTVVLSAEYMSAAVQPSGADAACIDGAAETVPNDGSNSAPWRVSSAPVDADGTPTEVRRMTLPVTSPPAKLCRVQQRATSESYHPDD